MGRRSKLRRQGRLVTRLRRIANNEREREAARSSRITFLAGRPGEEVIDLSKLTPLEMIDGGWHAGRPESRTSAAAKRDILMRYTQC